MVVCPVYPVMLCSSDRDGTCAVAGGNPFKACDLLFNKCTAGKGRPSSDGQRVSEGVKARGFILTPGGSRAPWRGNGGGG